MFGGVLGIDPGVSGACALFCPWQTAASGLRWVVIDMPVFGAKPELNAGVLRDWLRKHTPQHAFLELVTAMPSIAGPDGKRRGMGAASAFRFGAMFGSIKATLACCDVPYTLVTPRTWKKAHGLAGPDKERSRALAIRLFPDQSEILRRVKDQNRAEAMLIAEYGARPYQSAVAA